MSHAMLYVTVRTGQLGIYCIAASWQLLHFALLAVYAQELKAVQPITFITLGSIKYLNLDNESLGYIYFAVCSKCQHLFVL